MLLPNPFMEGSLIGPKVLLFRIIELTPIFKQLICPDHRPDNRKIFYNVIPRPKGREQEHPHRPYILITSNPPVASRTRVVAAPGWATSTGALAIITEVPVEQFESSFPGETEDDEELIFAWENTLDRWKLEIIETAYGQNGNNDHQLDIDNIEIMQPGRNSAGEALTNGGALMAMFVVTWGPAA